MSAEDRCRGVSVGAEDRYDNVHCYDCLNLFAVSRAEMPDTEGRCPRCRKRREDPVVDWRATYAPHDVYVAPWIEVSAPPATRFIFSGPGYLRMTDVVVTTSSYGSHIAPAYKAERIALALFATDPQVDAFVRHVGEATEGARYWNAMFVAWQRDDGGHRTRCERIAEDVARWMR